MRRCVLVLAAVCLLGSAACGDDGNELSEEEYLAQANELCAEGNAEIEALDESLPEIPTTAEEIDPYLDSWREILHTEFDDIRDLNGPSDLEDDVDALVDEVEALVDGLTADDFLTLEEDPFLEIDERAEELGLTVCANS